MNRLKTEINGKFPLFLNDARWIEEGIKDGLKGILNSFNDGDPFIIFGCEISSNAPIYSCTPGYVFMNGEVYYCTGGDVSLGVDNTLIFEEEISYDPAGLKLFGSGVSHDTYQIRRALFTQIADSQLGDELQAINGSRMHDNIFNLLMSKIDEGSWVAPLLENSWNNVGDGVKYRKDLNRVTLRGRVTASTGPATIFFLPEGFRPDVDMYFYQQYPDETSPPTVRIKVQASNGAVLQDYSSSGYKVILDGISFIV